MTEPIRVLIADDEALVRGGFRVLIETESPRSRSKAAPPKQLGGLGATRGEVGACRPPVRRRDDRAAVIQRAEGRIVGAGDVELFWRGWRPEVLLICHGLGEPPGRYGNVVDAVLPDGWAHIPP